MPEVSDASAISADPAGENAKSEAPDGPLSEDESPVSEDESPVDDDERVDESSRESFPASDPPEFWAGPDDGRRPPRRPGRPTNP